MLNCKSKMMILGFLFLMLFQISSCGFYPSGKKLVKQNKSQIIDIKELTKLPHESLSR